MQAFVRARVRLSFRILASFTVRTRSGAWWVFKRRPGFLELEAAEPRCFRGACAS